MKSILIIIMVYSCGVASCQSPRPPESSNNKDSLYTFSTPSPDGTGKFFMGREIAHIMGAAGADWLERPERQKEENTSLAIQKMNLAPDAVVADIGAGTGYYTFRIADKVPKGKVYAVEVQDEMIGYLNQNKKDKGSQNVIVIKGDSMNVNIPDNSVDLAILVDVYHELEYPKEIIRSVNKSLKPAGKILLIEYRGEDPSVPIKPLHKTSVAQLKKEFNSHGFDLAYQGDFMPIQHFIIFKRK